MRDGGPQNESQQMYNIGYQISNHEHHAEHGDDRLAHAYQRELSQGVALERVSVVKNTASALYDWEKLSLVIVWSSRRGPRLARRRFFLGTL